MAKGPSRKSRRASAVHTLLAQEGYACDSVVLSAHLHLRVDLDRAQGAQIEPDVAHTAVC
jgi:hypothetical protein